MNVQHLLSSTVAHLVGEEQSLHRYRCHSILVEPSTLTIMRKNCQIYTTLNWELLHQWGLVQHVEHQVPIQHVEHQELVQLLRLICWRIRKSFMSGCTRCCRNDWRWRRVHPTLLRCGHVKIKTICINNIILAVGSPVEQYAKLLPKLERLPEAV
ncbi:hypothetical protein Salat_2515700 [Sesamum alatum]|uniref:Uncharacterized protein n=1 Tax=Sesamum alatum TaxID=300844 RepID=A0AAE1XRY8_9LAMI|nr:hypothetical protein Salat_2515700 [Sesamum alatum]